MVGFPFSACFGQNRPKTELGSIPNLLQKNFLQYQTSLAFSAGAGDAEAEGAEELSRSTDRQLRLAVATVAMEEIAVAR